MARTRESKLVTFGLPFTGGGQVIPNLGNEWFVDTVDGDDGRSGKSFDKAFQTMAEALSHAATGDNIYFRGDVREEITGSNLKFDISIIGCGTRPHHADVPATGYNPGASVWRAPASPTTATPLLIVRGRGWRFVNILFDCPVDAAAVKLERNALSDVSEYDPSHASFIGCHFVSGLYGIQDAGGCYNVLVENCRFQLLSESGGAGIITSSTGVAVPLSWHIKNCRFLDNVNHIKVSASRWVIEDSVFIKHTTDAIKLNAVSSQGEYNVVVRNALGGTYSIAGGYTPGTNDEWGGNFNVISGGVTAADPA